MTNCPPLRSGLPGCDVESRARFALVLASQLAISVGTMQIHAMLLVVAAVLSAAPALAGDRIPLTPEMQVFLDQFRTAAKGQDREQLDKLTHRTAQGCNAEFHERVVAQHMRVLGKDAATKESWYNPARAEDLLRAVSRTAGTRWPVNPEVVIGVSFETGEASRTNVAYLRAAKDSGQWKWVPLCKDLRVL